MHFVQQVQVFLLSKEKEFCGCLFFVGFFFADLKVYESLEDLGFLGLFFQIS